MSGLKSFAHNASKQGDTMTPNLEVKTFTELDRNGFPTVLILAVWLGRVIEVDMYRGSDMMQIETRLLKVA